MARLGKILLFLLGVVFLLDLQVRFPERSDLKHPPRLHADEAVQWSLAKDAAGGVPYSVNEDKFHGPALAVATRGVFAARGLAFDDATVADLRQIPFCFFVLICAVPLCLTGVAWPMRLLAALLLWRGAAGCYFGEYFIQETLLVAGFVWGVLLWLRSADEGRPAWWAGFAGAAFGLALACKVTTAAYLGLFALALVWCARDTLTWRRSAWAVAGALVVGIALQTSLFTDGHGLVAWGHQFVRSFAVASGNADTLPLTNPGYWVAVGVWLALLVVARLLRRGPRSSADAPLVTAVGCFLFHLALPYKTPWLLFLPVCLSLTMVWPLLAEGTWWSRAVGFAGATAFSLVSVANLDEHTPTDAHIWNLPEQLSSYRADWQAAHPGRPFYVAIDGGHYWPLPYYLRAFQVGYGDFPAAAQAPVRFLVRTDASRPEVPGYRAYSLDLRKGERYWVLLDASVKLKRLPCGPFN
ncbi:MAG: hypothetical protein RLZZ405_181 [Verrucomicrobiota bacterium]|jgi:hypothetical protein